MVLITGLTGFRAPLAAQSLIGKSCADPTTTFARAGEAITQPPAPSHPTARGRAGPKLLAHILFAKYGLHLPLNRQSDVYQRKGINLDV